MFTEKCESELPAFKAMLKPLPLKLLMEAFYGKYFAISAVILVALAPPGWKFFLCFFQYLLLINEKGSFSMSARVLHLMNLYN